MTATVAITTAHILNVNHAVAQAAGMAFRDGGVVATQTVHPGFRLVTILLATLMTLSLAKAVLIVLLGAESYGASLAVLQGGGIVDHAGAVLMGVDSLTAALVQFMS